jgi:hypothetical protein
MMQGHRTCSAQPSLHSNNNIGEERRAHHFLFSLFDLSFWFVVFPTLFFFCLLYLLFSSPFLIWCNPHRRRDDVDAFLRLRGPVVPLRKENERRETWPENQHPIRFRALHKSFSDCCILHKVGSYLSYTSPLAYSFNLILISSLIQGVPNGILLSSTLLLLGYSI